MQHIRTARLAAAAILLSSVAGAQDADPPEPRFGETIVVSANRGETPADEVGSSETVIGLEEIEARNQTYLVDLLRTVPGLEVTQSGGPGKAAGMRIRGSSSAQVLVLVDGVRVNTVNNGDFDISNLLADNVERIEILRGPQSAYGSEALAGVVSIVTRRGQGPARIGLRAEAGSADHSKLGLSISGSNEQVDYSFSASDLHTNAVSHRSPASGGGGERDPYDNRNASLRLGHDLSPMTRIEAVARVYDGDAALDDFFGDDLNAEQQTAGWTGALSLLFNPTTNWHQTLRFASREEDLSGLDPDPEDIFSNFDIRSKLLELSTQADLDLGTRHLLSLGGSWERREGINVGGFDEEAELSAFYAQDQWRLGERGRLTAAVRQDHHSVFGDEATYRLTAAVGSADGRSRFHGSWGTGFRAPNFNELYFPFSGTATLRPETSRGLDLGFEHRLLNGRLVLAATAFAVEFHDMIDFDLRSFVFQNLVQAESRGAEVSLDYRANRSLDLALSHTWNETEDLATRRPLARRPEHRSSLVLRYRARERIEAAAMAYRVVDRIDSNGRSMDDYDRVDVALRWVGFARVAPYVRVENVLDRNYEEVPGFTSPDRTWAIGIALELR